MCSTPSAPVRCSGRATRTSTARSPACSTRPCPETLLLPIAVVVGVLGLSLAVRAHHGPRPCSACWSCAATGLLTSPITWTHHLVWIIPVLAWLALAERWSASRPMVGRRRGPRLLGGAHLVGTHHLEAQPQSTGAALERLAARGRECLLPVAARLPRSERAPCPAPGARRCRSVSTRRAAPRPARPTLREDEPDRGTGLPPGAAHGGGQRHRAPRERRVPMVSCRGARGRGDDRRRLGPDADSIGPRVRVAPRSVPPPTRPIPAWRCPSAGIRSSRRAP